MPSGSRKKGKSDKSKSLSPASSKSHSSLDTTNGGKNIATNGEGRSSQEVIAHSLECATATNSRGKGQDAQSDQPNVFEFLEDTENQSSDDMESDVEPRPSEALSRCTHPNDSLSVRASRRVNPSMLSGASKGSVDDDQPDDTKIAVDFVRQYDLKIAGAYQGDVESRSDTPSPADDDHFDLSSPESYYVPSRVRPPPRDLPSPPPSLPEKSGPLTIGDKKMVKQLIRTGDLLSSANAGYAYIASKLDSSVKEGERLPPLYRKFEAVNHRVLLYLQDEISQLQEDLQYLDGCEEKQRLEIAHEDGTKPTLPSRRVDWQSQKFSDLHRRRIDVLERLTIKTHEYNTALAAYSKVVQTLPRASTKDIAFYRRWMHENSPIAKPETRFLQHDLDLVSLTVSVGARHETNILYFLVGVLTTALLLPLLAY